MSRQSHPFKPCPPAMLPSQSAWWIDPTPRPQTPTGSRRMRQAVHRMEGCAACAAGPCAMRRPRRPAAGRDAGYGAREGGAHWLGAGTTVSAFMTTPFLSSIPLISSPSRFRVRLVQPTSSGRWASRRVRRATAAFASAYKTLRHSHQHYHDSEVASENSD